MYTTPNLSLKVWDSDSDTFDRQDLIDNWEAIDDDYARQRSANQVELLASVPVTNLFDGRLVYLTAASGGFAAKTIIRYNGSTWAAVGPSPEVLSALPTAGNYQGRLVALTGASGGFQANDVVINTNGSNSWKRVGGVGVGTSLPSSPIAGDMWLLTASAGGFDAWSLVTYTGSAWITTERRGVQVGPTLPVSPYAGQMFVLTASNGGFAAYDVVRYNGAAWGKVNGASSYVSGTWPTSPAEGDLIMTPWGTGYMAHWRYNSSGAAGQKWEHIGAGPLVSVGNIGSTYTVPRSGAYIIHWGTAFSAVNHPGYSWIKIHNNTSNIDVVPMLVNGTPGTQQSGITVSSAMAGWAQRFVTLTGGHVLQAEGTQYSGFSFLPIENITGWAIQPVRVTE